MRRFKFLFTRKVNFIKIWLESNKIFFETALMLILSVASLIMAYNSNKIAKQSNQIAEMEVELAKQANMPSFTFLKSANDYHILNVGGTITDAQAYFEYYLFIDATMNDIKKIVKVRVIDAYSDNYAMYDYSNNSFSATKNNLCLSSMISEIQDNLIKNNISIRYYILELACINYYDYSGKSCIEYYKINSFLAHSMKEISFENYLNLTNMCDKFIWSSERILEVNPDAVKASTTDLENYILEKFELK